jgi:hypothetical protein
LAKRYSWLSFLHPDLSGGLIAIVIFLLVIAIGNAFRVYSAILDKDTFIAWLSAASVIVYAVPALGLLRLKRWARFFEIGFCVLLALLGLLIMVVSSPYEGGFIVVTHGYVAYYLWSKKCRMIFYPEA